MTVTVDCNIRFSDTSCNCHSYQGIPKTDNITINPINMFSPMELFEFITELYYSFVLVYNVNTVKPTHK